MDHLAEWYYSANILYMLNILHKLLTGDFVAQLHSFLAATSTATESLVQSL